MPIMLLIETDGGISEFVVKPIDRKTRQAVTKRLAVDSLGRECSRAMLTHDGLLLKSGSISDLHEDADGNSVEVEHGEVVATDDGGNVLRNLPATTGRPQRPLGPIPPEELLGHTVMKAYALIPVAIARDLGDSLAGGDVYRVAFRPRTSVNDSPAFILANQSGMFLLQCKPCLIEFIRLDQPIVLEDDLDDEDDLWDGWQVNTDSTGGDQW
ncbi:MAG: hypothetical protein M1133_08340 [Armatimonadetes bacterium]|nr:hypothetical protein [Armatimonadota bacterium]